jgi:carbon starvation protein
VQGFVVLEIVLALIFAYDFFRSLRSISPKGAGFSEAVKP